VDNKVGYQGEVGAFSELAAHHFRPDQTGKLVPIPTFEELFERLSDDTLDEIVIPIENTLYGSVHANYDLLLEHNAHIVQEMKLRVRHNLLVLPGTTYEDIKVVSSHPQALGQCRAFLTARLPHAEIVPSYDTAGSAKKLAAEMAVGHAAIASRAAAKEYNLEVLAEGIESNHENYTRFLLLRPGSAKLDEAKGATFRTSIVYAMQQNIPGALFKSLAVFALRELDLLKIESRPLIGSPFEYVFYLDFKGRLDEVAVGRALDHLEEMAAYVKLLGSYPAGPVVN